MGTKKKKTDKKKTDNEKNSILQEKNIVQIIGAVCGILPILYWIVDKGYNIGYQNKCEKFYHLSAKYFQPVEWDLPHNLLYLLGVAVLLLMCIYPYRFNKFCEKNGQQTKGNLFYIYSVSICLGLEIGILNVYNLQTIMDEIYKVAKIFSWINEWIIENGNVIIGIIMACSVVTLIGSVLMGKIKYIKNQKIRKIIKIVYAWALGISILIMFYGVYARLNFSISDKTEYEVVKVQGKEYFVITEVNDHELIAEYVIDKNGVYNIVTDYYKFIDKNSGDSYQYIQLKSSPKVQFSVEETENTSW